jgi:hypothetical protein
MTAPLPRDEDTMEHNQLREEFDTGLSKVRQEIKSLLANHGLYGSVTNTDTGMSALGPSGVAIELVVKGRKVDRSFDRQQIEGCRLRVGGVVLAGIIAMVDEAAA